MPLAGISVLAVCRKEREREQASEGGGGKRSADSARKRIPVTYLGSKVAKYYQFRLVCFGLQLKFVKELVHHIDNFLLCAESLVVKCEVLSQTFHHTKNYISELSNHISPGERARSRM